MPDDDVDMMGIICPVAYHYQNAVSDLLSPQDFLKVAIAARKHDCIFSITNASRHWLKPAGTADIEEFMHLMAAAYLLNDPKAFQRITCVLSPHHTGPFHGLVQGEVESIVLWRVLCEQPL